MPCMPNTVKEVATDGHDRRSFLAVCLSVYGICWMQVKVAETQQRTIGLLKLRMNR